MYRNNLAIILIPFALSIAIFPVEALAYTYTEIVVPGLTGATATSINNHGDIVGYGTGSGGTVGFLASGSNFTLLSAPGSTSTQPNGINDAGDIVGAYTDSSGTHGFKYTAGSYTTIDAPSPAVANKTTLTAINNIGQIAGVATIITPDTNLSGTDGFVDTAGTFAFAPIGPLESLTIGGINDSGQIAGGHGGAEVPETPTYGTVSTFHQNTSLHGYFSAINDGGQFIYIQGTVSYLQLSATQTTPGSPIFFQGSNQTTGLSMNNGGTVVGYYIDTSGAYHAFLAAASAPACSVSNTSGSPRQMTFTIQDGAGLVQIAVTAAINATTSIPSFVAGMTSPIVVTSQATNPPQTASVTLTATDTGGLTSSCSSRIGGTGAPWTGLGGVITSSVGVGLNQNGSLDAFGLGSDSTLWHIAQSGPAGPWGPWGGAGGSSLSSQPAVVTDGAGQIEVLGISSDGTLWQIAQTAPGNWSGAIWHDIASGVKGRPSVVCNGAGQLQAFVRANNDSILVLTQSSPGSASWQAMSMGGVVIGNPSAAVVSSTAVDVVAIGTDGALWLATVDSQGDVGSWSSLGGSLKGDPVLLSRPPYGRLYAFSRGTDDALWFASTPGYTSWSSFQSLGGIMVNKPTAIINSDGRPEVFVVGTDNGVWHTEITVGEGSEWSPWATLGGVISGEVTPALDASGAINLLVIGTDSGLCYLTQPLPGSWQ